MSVQLFCCPLFKNGQVNYVNLPFGPVFFLNISTILKAFDEWYLRGDPIFECFQSKDSNYLDFIKNVAIFGALVIVEGTLKITLESPNLLNVTIFGAWYMWINWIPTASWNVKIQPGKRKVSCILAILLSHCPFVKFLWYYSQQKGFQIKNHSKWLKYLHSSVFCVFEENKRQTQKERGREIDKEK